MQLSTPTPQAIAARPVLFTAFAPVTPRGAIRPCGRLVLELFSYAFGDYRARVFWEDSQGAPREYVGIVWGDDLIYSHRRPAWLPKGVTIARANNAAISAFESAVMRAKFPAAELAEYARIRYLSPRLADYIATVTR